MTYQYCPWLREKVEMEQSGAENVNKTSAREGKKQHFWLYVSASWEYKVQACNNVSSVFIQFG